MKKIIPILILTGLVCLISCKQEVEPIIKKTLSVSSDSLEFVIEGGIDSITITTDAVDWHVISSAQWVKPSVDFGISKLKTIAITVEANAVKEVRTAILKVYGGNADTVYIKIKQLTKSINGTDYQNFKDSIAPDATGMNSTAMEISNKIITGWNIGNTLEAIGGETAWGNPMITNDLIKTIKKSGFNAIRLPCSWNSYSNQTTGKINSSWLNRVKQVVQYCVDNDMYVILNIHWDGGWLENNCTEAKRVANNAKQKAFWEQIAVTLSDFDEHVLFASANEPNVSNATQMAVLLSYHQTFVNTVRSTGGKNAYRVLVVQGPSTDITTTNNLMTQMPTDKVPNRMMAEIHYYTPWNFCGMEKDETWGKMAYYWGKDYQSATDANRNYSNGEAEVDRLMALMKTKFINKGIPVIVGEFGAIARTSLTGDALKLHLASRAYYFKYVSKQAKANGLLPFFWDTGGIIDRRNYTVIDQPALDALIQGANGL